MVKTEEHTIDVLEQSNGTGRVQLSTMARGLIGSEILKIASDIRAMLAEGKSICNLTVGDFNPQEFSIPSFLEHQIAEALHRGETNYPPPDGLPQLKAAILEHYAANLGLSYTADSVTVTGGSRPGIYATYRALVDPGDTVLYPVPSWNNNHYCHLVGAAGVPVVCSSDDAFLPTKKILSPVIRHARLLALNSPLNPTGTAFTRDALEEICDLVLDENERRSADERPLFVLYDQVYWMLTFGSVEHVNPVSIRPEMRPYTIFVDGISKAFAATGVRVGWVVGPPEIVQRMTNLLAHIGAWAPRAEQHAVAKLLSAPAEIAAYHQHMKPGIQSRLEALYTGILELRKQGFAVDAIPPMGAMYLTTRFAFAGKRTPNGETLHTNEDIRRYLLSEAGLAIVPFHAFGVQDERGWFRLSVGAVSLKQINEMLPRLRRALAALTGQ